MQPRVHAPAHQAISVEQAGRRASRQAGRRTELENWNYEGKIKGDGATLVARRRKACLHMGLGMAAAAPSLLVRGAAARRNASDALGFCGAIRAAARIGEGCPLAGSWSAS